MPESPFEIITPNKPKSSSKGLIIALVIGIFLILSIIVGVILVRQNQNVSEKAAVGDMCPAAQACPVSGQPNLLRSCTPPEAGGGSVDSLCNVVGRVEVCNNKNYCCPSVGGSWTLDMTACKTPTPTVAPTTSTQVNAVTKDYVASEIATHSTSSNCWLIISNKVYDVSTYLVKHPGGVSIVTPYCGKEATQAFNTRGGNGSHSNSAKSQLQDYFVGNLASSTQTATSTPSPTPTQLASSGNISCNGSCTSSSQCGSGRVCYITSGSTGFCRNSVCVSQTGCICPTNTASPTSSSTKTSSPTPTSTSTSSTATTKPSSTPTTIAQTTSSPKVQTTPLPIPETGINLPTILTGVVGVIVLIGSFILAF